MKIKQFDCWWEIDLHFVKITVQEIQVEYCFGFEPNEHLDWLVQAHPWLVNYPWIGCHYYRFPPDYDPIPF